MNIKYLFILLTLLAIVPLSGQCKTATERMSKDSTRQISSEIVSKYYLEDVEPPVFEYIIWLSCDIKDEECSYKFRIITYPTERNDSSVILLKLKSGETVTLYPYYYMKSVNYYTLPYGYLNHEYTDCSTLKKVEWI